MFSKSSIDFQKPVLTDQGFKFPAQSCFAQTNFPKDLTYFHIMGHEEPHLLRRKQILEKHPEITALYGPDPNTAWLVITFTAIQFLALSHFQQAPFALFVLSSYLIGGTMSHALHGAVHDLTHHLGFKNAVANKLLAISCNFAQGVPSAIAFGRYHADHHTFMGIADMDPDLPSQFELSFVKGCAKKILFMILLPFFYAVRPLIVRPMKPTGFELLNIAAVVIADILIVQYWGGRALGWLLLSCYFGLSGFHPLAVHLIAEHYEFINRLETYNYIGWANFFIMNIGYHTEHHDFPMIPWSRLPLVRRMAPEFYEHLPCYDSYLEVAFHYVFDEFMGPFSRIIRKTKKEL